MGLQRFRPIIGAVAVTDQGGLIAGDVRAHRDRGDRPGEDRQRLHDDAGPHHHGGPGRPGQCRPASPLTITHSVLLWAGDDHADPGDEHHHRPVAPRMGTGAPSP